MNKEFINPTKRTDCRNIKKKWKKLGMSTGNDLNLATKVQNTSDSGRFSIGGLALTLGHFLELLRRQLL